MYITCIYIYIHIIYMQYPHTCQNTHYFHRPMADPPELTVQWLSSGAVLGRFRAAELDDVCDAVSVGAAAWRLWGAGEVLGKWDVYGTIIWVNYNDLTATSLGIMANKGNHPQMAELFRLVKYYIIWAMVNTHG